LLYHPSSTVARTPASAGLAFDAVSFAATEAGETRLKGWWIPAGAGARQHRYTVLYLHGQDGNLGDSVDELAALHAAGANVLAFDYRGYGQSLFEHPSEARWRQDATWALAYLTDARQIAATSIVLYGKGLGANLALELAAEHPELAGVVVESPLDDPLRAVFGDPRARMVPARLLVQDRYDTTAATKRLRTPSLWLIATATPDQAAGRHPEGYDQVAAPKSLVRLAPMPDASQQWSSVLSVWLDELPSRSGIH
jgi:pimeloyl-ACP methyl ester carboxylesterase